MALFSINGPSGPQHIVLCSKIISKITESVKIIFLFFMNLQTLTSRRPESDVISPPQKSAVSVSGSERMKIQVVLRYWTISMIGRESGGAT